MRYDRGNIVSTAKAAVKVARTTKTTKYIIPTAFGFAIVDGVSGKNDYYEITGESAKLIRFDIMTGARTEKSLPMPQGV